MPLTKHPTRAFYALTPWHGGGGGGGEESR